MSLRQKTINCVLPLPQAALDIRTRATAEAWSKNGRPYKRLPTRFRRDGFEYRQIAREGDTAIYEQTWSGRTDPSVCYEVIRLRRREGFQIGGRFVEPAEIYPNADAWGVDGFTLTDRDAAFAKLRELARGSVAPNLKNEGRRWHQGGRRKDNSGSRMKPPVTKPL